MEHAAVGTRTQIEFYNIEEERYFSIYKAPGEGLNYVSIGLSDWKVSRSDSGFTLERGAKSHHLSFVDSNGNNVRLIFRSHLWNRLLYRQFSGEISATGRAVVERNLSKYV